MRPQTCSPFIQHDKPEPKAGQSRQESKPMSAIDLNLLFSAIAALAILLYMAPGVLRLSPTVRRYTEPAALGLIGIGMAAGILFWLFGG